MSHSTQEYFDEPEQLAQSARKLAEQVRASKHFVVYTGAGISTAAQIPDYRGPNGVWTLKAQGKMPKMKISLEAATPTYSHMALVALHQAGLLKYVVSTNCDGLHRRSGIPGNAISEVHGNIYREYCQDCGAEYIRPFDVRQKKRAFIQTERKTGRLCQEPACSGHLRDSIVNFGENLPEEEFGRATENSERADVTLVIGSSMMVQPACSLPALSYEMGGAFSICNLQRTSYDTAVRKSGGVRVFGKCDEFMALLMAELDLPVDVFAECEADVAAAMSQIIVDPEYGQGMKKYNVYSMSDDGPPPPGVLSAIQEGFSFSRHVKPQVRSGDLLGRVVV